MAKLIIVRSLEYVNSLRAIRLILNGNVLGAIGNGETKTFDIPAGEHIVMARIDWCGSRMQKINLHDGEELTLNLSGFKGSKFIGSKYTWAISILFVLAMIFLKNELREYIKYTYLAFCIIMLMLAAYIFTVGRNRYLILERPLDKL